MEPDTSRQAAVGVFRNLVNQLLEQLHTSFPECQGTRDAVKRFSAMSTEDTFLLAAAHAHRDHLLSPLGEEVAYAAPLTRLRAREPEGGCQFATFYDAYTYTDADTVLGCDYPFVIDMRLREKWADPYFDDDSKRGVFDFLRAINDAAMQATRSPIPRLITVAEIQAEIEENGEGHDGGAGIVAGFDACLGALIDEAECDRGSLHDARAALSKEQLHVAFEQWGEIATDGRATFDDRNWVAACELLRASAGIIGAVGEHLVTVTPTPELWIKLEHINLISRLSRKTPPHLLEVIESRAGDLASRMADGTFDLSSQNIMQVGEDIMGQCNVEDLQIFSRLINEELETIMSTLNASGGAGGIPDLAKLGIDPAMVGGILGSLGGGGLEL